MSDTESIYHWPWEKTTDEEGPTIQEFRLSVRSVLNKRDREMLEIASEVLSGTENRMSRVWAVEVMKDIFSRFGLEFRHSMCEGSVRKSVTENSDGRSSEDRRSNDDELDEEEEEEAPDDELPPIDISPFVFPPKLDVLMETDEKDNDEDNSNPEDEDHDDDDSNGDYPDWRTPPLTPAESIEDRHCIPCNLKRFSSGSPKRPVSRSMPTPPVSPPNVVTTAAPVALRQEKHPSPDKNIPLRPPPHDDVPNSPKSFIKSLGKRMRRASMRLRVSIISRAAPLPALSPGPPPPIPKRSSKRNPLTPPPTTLGSSDPQAIYGGPTLKLNRLSDVTLPLTQEERNEIARRRARESNLTEDFDLVVRLGTMRTSSRSSMAFTDGMDSLGEVPIGANISSIPHIPMVEPEHLSKGTLVGKETERIPPRRRITNQFSRLSNRSSSLRRTVSSPDSRVVRNVLSESNLRLHTARTNSQRSRIEDAIPSPPPSRTGFRFGDTLSARRRSRSPSPTSSLRRQTSLGRRYPSMDYFPLAQTTALGLRGGKIGVVQMGSAYKANKILGDIVLIVPEHQRGARKRRRRMIETISPVVPHGSIKKVERLRGEKLPVEPFQRWGSMSRRTSIAKSMEQIIEAFEDGQRSVQQSDEAKPNGEPEQTGLQRKRSIREKKSYEGNRTTPGNRTSNERRRSGSSSHMRSTSEDKSSMEYTLPSSVDGRKSGSEVKGVKTDQRLSVDGLRPKSNGAVWII